MTFPPAVRDVSGAWLAFMGIDRDSPETYATASSFAKAPADEAWVYSCVRRLYSSAQGVPLRVYVKAGRDLIPADDEPSPEGDDLQALLDFVNPVDMTGSDLKSFTVASYAVWGESYWRKVRGRYGGAPQELYWLRAPDVDVKAPNGRRTIAYVHKPQNSGESETYEPRDIVPFRTPNLANPLRGLSPLSAIRTDIQTSRGWATQAASSLANDSIPPGYWQIPKDAEFSPTDKSLVQRMLRSLRGPKNKGKVPVMPAGIEFHGIALTPADAEAIHQRKLSRMAVCAALGVPLVLAGDDEKSSVYANLRDAERVFWRGTMIPLLDSYADVVNNWLVPDFDPSRKRLVVAFDYSDIEALRPTLDVEMNTWLGLVYAQVAVPNEFRRRFRIGKDVPWGNQPIPRTQVALRPDPSTIPVGMLPVMDPTERIQLPESAQSVTSDGGDEADVSGVLRSYGKSLYRQSAVKSWVSHPSQPLDTDDLLGHPVSPDVRLSIEAGLRRRDSAAAIAAQLEVLA